MLWLARELWSNHAKRNDQRDTETQKNTAAILTLDKSIVELQGQIKLLMEQCVHFKGYQKMLPRRMKSYEN